MARSSSRSVRATSGIKSRHGDTPFAEERAASIAKLKALGYGNNGITRLAIDAETGLTPKQLELDEILCGLQRHTLFFGGARSGKTVLFVRAIMLRAILAPGSRHAILRFRGNAARNSIWLDTMKRVYKHWFPKIPMRDHKQDG